MAKLHSALLIIIIATLFVIPNVEADTDLYEASTSSEYDGVSCGQTVNCNRGGWFGNECSKTVKDQYRCKRDDYCVSETAQSCQGNYWKPNFCGVQGSAAGTCSTTKWSQNMKRSASGKFVNLLSVDLNRVLTGGSSPEYTYIKVKARFGWGGGRYTVHISETDGRSKSTELGELTWAKQGEWTPQVIFKVPSNKKFKYVMVQGSGISSYVDDVEVEIEDVVVDETKSYNFERVDTPWTGAGKNKVDFDMGEIVYPNPDAENPLTLIMRFMPGGEACERSAGISLRQTKTHSLIDSSLWSGRSNSAESHMWSEWKTFDISNAPPFRYLTVYSSASNSGGSFLSALDSAQCGHLDKIAYRITNNPEVVRYTSAFLALKNVETTVDGTTASFKVDIDKSWNSEVTYSWDFGDGGLIESTESNEITHTYPASGRYLAKVIVKDQYAQKSDTFAVNVGGNVDAIDLDFPVYATGKEGWQSCENGITTWSQIDAYCRFKGYSGAAGEAACFYAPNETSWNWDGQVPMVQGDPANNSLAIVQVNCVGAQQTSGARASSIPAISAKTVNLDDIDMSFDIAETQLNSEEKANFEVKLTSKLSEVIKAESYKIDFEISPNEVYPVKYQGKAMIPNRMFTPELQAGQEELLTLETPNAFSSDEETEVTVKAIIENLYTHNRVVIGEDKFTLAAKAAPVQKTLNRANLEITDFTITDSYIEGRTTEASVTVKNSGNRDVSTFSIDIERVYPSWTTRQHRFEGQTLAQGESVTYTDTFELGYGTGVQKVKAIIKPTDTNNADNFIVKDIDFLDNPAFESLQDKTCSERGGLICSSSQMCSGSNVQTKTGDNIVLTQASDTDSCCLSKCIDLSNTVEGGDLPSSQDRGAITFDKDLPTPSTTSKYSSSTYQALTGTKTCTMQRGQVCLESQTCTPSTSGASNYADASDTDACCVTSCSSDSSSTASSARSTTSTRSSTLTGAATQNTGFVSWLMSLF